jgi:hypothetical protein
LTHTSTEWAPWWVIPSDNKWVSRALVSAILTDAIHGLGLKPRRVSEAQLQVLAEARAQLLSEP